VKKRHLFWILLPSYWILIAIAIVAVLIYGFHFTTSLYFQSLETDLKTRAILLGEQAKSMVLSGNYADLDALCKRLGKSSATRFTAIASDGKVLGDSDRNPKTMENHSNRPEIQQALTGQTGVDHRFSQTLRKEMMYVAMPLKDEHGCVPVVIRASLPMTVIKEQLQTMSLRIVTAALLIGLLAMVLCIFMVRYISSPLRNMSDAASRYANGDFSLRIPPQKTVELDRLATALNEMSERLNHTLITLNEQRNEQRAVLSSMTEGVLAVDKRGRIIHMNRAAGKILNVNRKEAKHRQVREVVRYVSLQEFIKAVQESREPIEKDLILTGDQEIHLQIRGTVLKSEENEPIGALIIMWDVTHLRHLETVRSEFVANVSHELKTPITSIAGFVETLLSEDWNLSEKIRHFLNIIKQQTDRLDAIIDDLLTLSRLEQKNEKVIKEPEHLNRVLKNAVRLCELQAKQKSIRIQLDCPSKIVLNINAPLIEQVFVNLIINAVKYSDPAKTVRVTVKQEKDEVIIYVKDEGYGIEKQHLDRLFERFYRVDTARSRKLGGTGLGLSIAKHIVQAHGGSIQVESKIGFGSTFKITLPRN